jgi:hypothetical protein
LVDVLLSVSEPNKILGALVNVVLLSVFDWLLVALGVVDVSLSPPGPHWILALSVFPLVDVSFDWVLVALGVVELDPD